VSLLRLALVTPEARKAHCSAEFPGFCLLHAGDRERALETRFCFRCVRLGRFQRDFASNAIDLGLDPFFLRRICHVQRVADAGPSVLQIPKCRMGEGSI